MHRLKRLQTIVSDWSGVISNDIAPVYEANSRMLEHYGLPRMTFDDWMQNGIRKSPREYFLEHGVAVDGDEVFELYRRIYPEVVASGTRPTMYRNAPAFLSHVAPRLIMVVSAHPREMLEREALQYGIHGFFRSLRGSVKDKAEAILELLRTHGRDISSAAYIGDMTHDIEAAKRAGVLSIATAGGYHSRQRLAAEKPDILVDSLGELLPHL